MDSSAKAIEAHRDREAYAKAMIDGNHVRAFRIEQKYGFDGYTPELVSIGLSAISEGKDGDEAIEKHLQGDDE